MRVCIIGTSNAIYRDGYAAGVRDHRHVTCFEKHALGASPSVIVPYLANKIDFSRFDWVVFETTINDQNYLKYGSIRKEQIREFIEWGIARASSQGCRTALMVMPTIPGLKGGTIPRLIYRKIAEESGALLFDGFAHLGDCDASSFIDRFHVKKPIARRLGQLLAERLYAARRSYLPIVSPRSHFYCRPAIVAEGARLVSRSTSMVTAEFAVLDGGASIHVDAGPWDELAGVAYNAACSSATLSFGGDPSVTKSLRTKYAFADRELLMLVAPVTGRPRAGKTYGGFPVRLVAKETQPDEASRFDHIPDSVDDLPYKAEVGEFIFRRRLRYAGAILSNA